MPRMTAKQIWRYIPQEKALIRDRKVDCAPYYPPAASWFLALSARTTDAQRLGRPRRGALAFLDRLVLLGKGQCASCKSERLFGERVTLETCITLLHYTIVLQHVSFQHYSDTRQLSDAVLHIEANRDPL